jgi:origin recognition complex subunit 3
LLFHDIFSILTPQGCYIFKSASRSDHDIDDRPKKKRKTTKTRNINQDTWPKLCEGEEPLEHARLRQELFEDIWGVHQQESEENLSIFDHAVSEDLKSFVRSDNRSAKLKTGLILSGSNNDLQFKQLNSIPRTEDEDTVFVALPANQATNLQAALKNIIRQAIETDRRLDAYDNFVAVNKSLIPMSFDLELLEKFMQEHGLRKIVVSIPDAETYDLNVLAELLASLQSWKDRISFIILLGIATTTSLFENRLSKSTIRLLDTQSFDFSSTTDKLYDLFCRVHCSSYSRLFLNPATIKALSDVTEDQSTTPSSFLRVLKYIFMTHFFANPLSVMISRHLPEKSSTDSLCESIRNTSSFQKHCSHLLEQGKSHTKDIQELLENDAILLSQTRPDIHAITEHQQRLNQRIEQIVKLYKHLHSTAGNSLLLHSKLLQALSSSGFPDEIQSNISTSLNSLSSTDLLSVMTAHRPIFESALATMKKKPEKDPVEFISEINAKYGSVKSRYALQPQLDRKSISTSNLKTSTGTYAEGLYSGYVHMMITNLMDYILKPLLPPSAIATEAVIFANPGILRNTFQPRTRFTIERALSRPEDYLDWDFAAPPPTTKITAPRASVRRRSGRGAMNGHTEDPEVEAKVMVRVEKEPTALLYSLLTQASRDVNVRDLWDRFASELNPHSTSSSKSQATTVNGENGETEDSDNEAGDEVENTRYLPLFYNALAELKMLGMITGKNTDNIKGAKGIVRGVDVVSRSTWAGL